MSRNKKLTSVDKANVLSECVPACGGMFLPNRQGLSGLTTEFNFVDAITMWFVKNPEWFDVVVTPTCSATSSPTWEP